MKRPTRGGFTAASVLVVAILGGVVGGAVAMSGNGAAPAPAAPVTLHQVAEEATPAPTPTAASDPAGTVEPVTTPQDVATAAARAEAAAQRAEIAAGRAEKAADEAESTVSSGSAGSASTVDGPGAPAAAEPTPAPATTPAPVETPAPVDTPAPKCREGERKTTRAEPKAGPDGNLQPGTVTTWECWDGDWVIVKREPIPVPMPPPATPEAVAEEPALQG